MYWRWIVGGTAILVLIWLLTDDVSAEEEDTTTINPIDPSPSLRAFAVAISKAEGFGTVNAIPTRAKNPGDLARGDIGYGVLGSEKITVYASEEDGWQALYRQLNLIARRKSAYYTPDTTIAEMAIKYAPGAQAVNWARNVSQALNASPTDKIGIWIGDHS